MKKKLIFCSIILLVISCNGPEPQNKDLTYQNIVILSDLSSRIDNKPPKDIEEIHKIVQYFKNDCVKPGEKIGDKSSILFSSFSDKVIAAIDINSIKKLGDKQQFINSTGAYAKNGLNFQIDIFEQKVREAYSKIRNQGLDLISVLVDKIDNEPIIKKNTFLTDGIDTTFINYDNHIYVFTDGYLEYLNKNANKQFYFGREEIEKVRNFCKANNVNVIKALEINKNLRLPSNFSKNNNLINLHVLETHERDKNDKLQTYKNSKGLRDNEILEAVWRQWAAESGFKSFEWKKY